MAQDSNFLVDRQVVPFYLDGKPKVVLETYDVISPLTNEPCWKSGAATKEDALAAVDSAEKAFKSWRKTKPRERRDILLRAHDILKQRVEQSTQFSQTETGATENMIAFELGLGLELIRYVAGLSSTVQGTIPEIEGENAHAMVLKEPYGVVLAIAPWNGPHVLGLRSCIIPIAAGNTVVLKGPEASPATYFNFVDALHEAGLPPGVLNFLVHRPSDAAVVTQTLIEHPAVQKVNFTGSTAVGSIVAGLCGKALKPCLMELGGKAPAIVCEDADLELAANACALGAFLHSGQICMSTERIIVSRSVATSFKAHLKTAMDTQAKQNPSPQLIASAAVTKNRNLIKDAVTKGATQVLGGDFNTTESSTSRMQPIVIENVKPDMDIFQTESFGPTVSLFVVDSDEQAIELANNTAYGLSSAVYTRDLARGFKFAREIVSGAVHINGPTVHDEPNLPHGGVKSSGFGRFAGKDGLEEWVRTKTVTWHE